MNHADETPLNGRSHLDHGKPPTASKPKPSGSRTKLPRAPACGLDSS